MRTGHRRKPLHVVHALLFPFSTPQPTECARRGVGSQTATTTYAHPRCGRSAEDGSSRVPLPSGRTPRPFAVRVTRGPHSTPPTVRAAPTPTVAGCSRAAPETPLPKRSHLAARNPGAPPIRPDSTTLRPRPDLPACFAIATPSPAPRPPSALRSRRLTTFQVQDAGSNPRGRHRADADRVAMGWLVGRRWAPHRQDSLGLEFGMLRTSLPLVLPVDCVCGRTSRVVPASVGEEVSLPRPRIQVVHGTVPQKCARNTLPAPSSILYRPAIEGLRCHPLPTSSTRAPEVTPN